MFANLLESRRTREQSVTQVASSLVAHAMVIAIAIHLTGAAVAAVAPPVRPLMLAFRPAAPAPHAVSGSGGAPRAAIAPIRSAVTLPASLPGVAVALGAADVDVALSGTPSFDPQRLAVSTLPATVAPATDQPDVGAVRLSGPDPRYPEALRQLGITGVVQLRFVIDSTGHVSDASLTILESTDPRFDSAAIAAVTAARYRPAQRRGAAMAQLAEQVVRFSRVP